MNKIHKFGKHHYFKKCKVATVCVVRQYSMNFYLEPVIRNKKYVFILECIVLLFQNQNIKYFGFKLI